VTKGNSTQRSLEIDTSDQILSNDKSDRMCVCHVGREERCIQVLVRKHEGKKHLDHLDINGPHRASYLIGTRSSFPSSKADGAGSQPLTIYRQVKTGWSYTSTTQYASMACTEKIFIPTDGMCETYMCLSLFCILHQKWGCMDYTTYRKLQNVFLYILKLAQWQISIKSSQADDHIKV
jgi:hypothetical protein